MVSFFEIYFEYEITPLQTYVGGIKAIVQLLNLYTGIYIIPIDRFLLETTWLEIDV